MAAPLIDLDPSVGQVEMSFRFDLVDTLGNSVGQLHPDRTSAPQISMDPTRAAVRQLTGLVLPPGEHENLDLFSARVRPTAIYADGSEEVLGTFVFSDASNARQTATRGSGLTQSSSLLDLGVLFGADIPNSIGFAPGDSVVYALEVVLSQLHGIANTQIGFSPTTISAPISWQPGNTTWYAVLQNLCTLGGLMPPYFDRNGILWIVPPPTIDMINRDLVYNAGGRIIAGSIVESSNELLAPNRYIVIDSSGAAAPIVGIYDIPASAPYSYMNRGYYVTSTKSIQGLGTVTDAYAAAYTDAALDKTGYETVAFDSTIDPRHNTYDVIEYLGRPYRETSWSMTLSAGGTMQHQAQAMYK